MNILAVSEKSRKRIARRLKRTLDGGDPTTDNSAYSTIIMLATGTGHLCIDCLSMDGAPALDKKSAHHLVTCRKSAHFKDPAILTSCPICFKNIDTQHEPHSLLQMVLVGYGKSLFQVLKSALQGN